MCQLNVHSFSRYKKSDHIEIWSGHTGKTWMFQAPFTFAAAEMGNINLETYHIQRLRSDCSWSNMDIKVDQASPINMGLIQGCSLANVPTQYSCNTRDFKAPVIPTSLKFSCFSCLWNSFLHHCWRVWPIPTWGRFFSPTRFVRILWSFELWPWLNAEEGEKKGKGGPDGCNALSSAVTGFIKMIPFSFTGFPHN